VRAHAAWALGEIGRRLPADAAERGATAMALDRAAGDATADVREEAALARAAIGRAGAVARPGSG